MLGLPVLVAAGGVNSAGRTSRRHAYRRMIWSQLSSEDCNATTGALAQMMGIADATQILNHTLVREIEPDWFDYKAVRWHRRASLETGQSEAIFEYVPGGIGEGR